MNASGKGSISSFHYLVLLICLVLLPSAVLHGLMGVEERVSFAVFAPLLLGAGFLSGRIRYSLAVPSIVLSVVIGAIASLVSDAYSQLLMGITLAVAIIGGQLLFSTLRNFQALRLATWFCLALMIGGILGSLYFYFGGAPLYEVQVGYRRSYLYLSTFSFAEIGSFIRPSGIFDEPGGLIMFVAIVTMFNDVFRQNARLNAALMVLMILTGSLAGLSLAILYFLTSKATLIYRKQIFVFVPTVVGSLFIVHSAFPNNPVSSALDTFYSDRLQFQDGRLAGDNRTNQIEEFFQIVDDEILLRGANVSSAVYEHYDLSSNPFSIVFGYGVIISLPYYGLLAWLLWIAAKSKFRNAYTVIGLVLLLLQRPYLFNMSWSVLICAAVYLSYKSDVISREFRARGL